MKFPDVDLRTVGTRLWRVLSPYQVRLDSLGGLTHSVPQGFLTDLASVPRIPLVYWTVGGRARRAALVHDHLYQVHPVPRSDADGAFWEIAADEEGPAIAWAMWLGIRAGGWWAWRSGPARFARFGNATVERRASPLR